MSPLRLAARGLERQRDQHRWFWTGFSGRDLLPVLAAVLCTFSSIGSLLDVRQLPEKHAREPRARVLSEEAR